MEVNNLDKILKNMLISKGKHFSDPLQVILVHDHFHETLHLNSYQLILSLKIVSFHVVQVKTKSLAHEI